MKKYLLSGLLTVILLMIFSQRVHAGKCDCMKTYNIYYCDEESLDPNDFKSRGFDFYGSYTDEQVITVLYTNLLDTKAFPEGTKLLGISISDGMLEADFSGNLLCFGGAENERAVVGALAKTATEIERIRYITIKIEGIIMPLPEGLEINKSDLGEILDDKSGRTQFR